MPLFTRCSARLVMPSCIYLLKRLSCPVAWPPKSLNFSFTRGFDIPKQFNSLPIGLLRRTSRRAGAGPFSIKAQPSRVTGLGLGSLTVGVEGSGSLTVWVWVWGSKRLRVLYRGL